MAVSSERIAELASDMKVKHRKFADLILAEWSQTDAYLEIYDTDPTHPLDRRTASRNGCRLLGHPQVRAYIEAINESAIDEVIINRAEVIAALADVALSGVTQGPGAGARVSAAKILLDNMQGGEKRTVTVQGPNGGPVETRTTTGASPELMDAILRRHLGIDNPEDL